jgi:hypothetical protein
VISWHKYVTFDAYRQTNSNQFKPIQTNSNQFKPIQTNSNQFKPIQTNSNQKQKLKPRNTRNFTKELGISCRAVTLIWKSQKIPQGFLFRDIS